MELKNEYFKFIKEYKKLEYLEQIFDDASGNSIVKESNISKRLLVVFDALYKTDSSVSLNDIPLKYPVFKTI